MKLKIGDKLYTKSECGFNRSHEFVVISDCKHMTDKNRFSIKSTLNDYKITIDAKGADLLFYSERAMKLMNLKIIMRKFTKEKIKKTQS